MTEARDPLRLMDAENVDPALRAALRQVSCAEPSAAEVAALAERVGDALSGGSGGGSLFSQFVSQTSGLKLMAVVVAGGAALWGATQALPVDGRRDVTTTVSRAVEPAAAVQQAPLATDRHEAASNPLAVVGDRSAVPSEILPRVESLSAPLPLAAPAPERTPAARTAAFGRHDGQVRSARARITGAHAAASAAPTDERATREQPAAAEGDESELVLITRAQSALKLTPRRALELLERHDDLYPAGHFAEEREVLWIDALSQLGMARALEARAQRFLASYPSSIHVARVRGLLAGIKTAR
jgi:hypothetical protein